MAQPKQTSSLAAIFIGFTAIAADGYASDQSGTTSPEKTAAFYISELELNYSHERFKDRRIGYEPTSYIDSYSNMELTFEYAQSDLTGNLALTVNLTDDKEITLDDAWLKFDWSDERTTREITFGAHPGYDDRGWFYDSTLDGLSLYTEGERSSLYLAAGSDSPTRKLPESLKLSDEGTSRWVASFTHWANDSLTLAGILTGYNDNRSVNDDRQWNLFLPSATI